ncbi:uncharacterized protein [Rutidosis leptorrhynchoides]|uniref:uncharacterized protein n=1 Tax=Rutidosis leptorrhynchoides TaxID=125765 RepID=UPI003A99FB12
MRILTVNIRGFNQKGKQGWFKKLIHDANPIIAAVQETRRKSFSDLWVENVWGSQYAKYASKECNGRSGGLLLIWDDSIFQVDQAVEGEFFIANKGKLSNFDSEFVIVNVYGPYNDTKKKRFWDSLNRLLSYDNAAWVFCGDFNEVRNVNERENTKFIPRRAARFNSFINDNGLIEIPLSKIYKDRNLSNHTPLLLKNGQFDFGPKPTRVFDTWIDAEGADHIVTEAWNISIAPYRTNTTFRLRLKNVKVKLKEWFNLTFGKLDSELKQLNDLCNWWEGEVEKRVLADSERIEWLNNRNECLFTEDEVWLAIKDCGVSKAPGPNGFNFHFYHKYWNVIKEDLMKAIQWFWSSGDITIGCNTSFITLIPKKSNPINLRDYRPISLIGGYYKILSKLLANRIRSVIDKLVGVEQSAFIRGRSILDIILIANKLVGDVKNNKARCFIFKADFEKAFDSARWNFLFDIMRKMGFGSKWLKWIESCFKSASISVLVNGSPTKEFRLQRGIRQGDPLSPYLFIIASEGLNILAKIAARKKIIRGVEIGRDRINITHLQFANDTIFFGDWHKRNISNVHTSVL